MNMAMVVLMTGLVLNSQNLCGDFQEIAVRKTRQRLSSTANHFPSIFAREIAD